MDRLIYIYTLTQFISYHVRSHHIHSLLNAQRDVTGLVVLAIISKLAISIISAQIDRDIIRNMRRCQ